MICIEDKSKCCGCTSCEGACPKEAISFNEDEEGFLYPIVDINKCINCGLCEKVCPYLKKNKPRTPIIVKAGSSRSQEILMNSSSGGIFSEMALDILRQKGVVVGAAFDENWNVKHIIVEDESELHRLRGSKYLQSNIVGVYGRTKILLDKGKKVLFSGTPCQVNGLKNYLHKDYDKLLCVEVICHGVPSPKVWSAYLSSFFKTKGTLKSINFRDKRQGWQKYGLNAIFSDHGEIYERRDKNLFLRGYLTDVFLRPSCYNCPSKEGRSSADISLGDYWGVKTNQPDAFLNKGIGVVLIYTIKGLDCFNRININSVSAEYDSVRKDNSMLVKSTPLPSDRELFWNEYCNKKVEAINFAIKRRLPSLHHRVISLFKLLLRRIKIELKHRFFA